MVWKKKVAACFGILGSSFLLASSALSQQQDDAAPSTSITIKDSPTAVDPATLVNEKLAASATVEFKESSLSEVAAWIQRQTGFTTLLDRRALADEGILTSEPIVDRLKDEPLYLLLDRLRQSGIAWRRVDGIIHLTSLAEDAVYTKQYIVGDLFDREYDPDALLATIEATIEPDSWDSFGGTGSAILLGDVMFVRQTHHMHRKVAGLLAALRDHGRRTLISDAPIHPALRAALAKPINVASRGVALATVVEQLANQCQADIRIDTRALESVGIRPRMPIDLELQGQSLQVGLNLLANQYELDWHLRNGVLWITSSDAVGRTVAVFDVRDLCRDMDESEALRNAVMNQSSPEQWVDLGGMGEISFPIAGTMVVYETERGLDAVLTLIENYRTALRASKPRVRKDSDPNAILTRYYRMPTGVAEDLLVQMRSLIAPETWQSESQRDAPGTILKITSWADVPNKEAKPGADPVPHSVLVIRQKRSVHDQIPTILNRIQFGQSNNSVGGSMGGGFFGGGGMGGSGGGFGGGFFSVPSSNDPAGTTRQTRSQ